MPVDLTEAALARVRSYTAGEEAPREKRRRRWSRTTSEVERRRNQECI